MQRGPRYKRARKPLRAASYLQGDLQVQRGERQPHQGDNLQQNRLPDSIGALRGAADIELETLQKLLLESAEVTARVLAREMKGKTGHSSEDTSGSDSDSDNSDSSSSSDEVLGAGPNLKWPLLSRVLPLPATSLKIGLPRREESNGMCGRWIGHVRAEKQCLEVLMGLVR